MNSVKIAALSGKRGAGKTAAALYLKEQYDFKIVSFAEQLKKTGEMMFPGVSTAAKEKPFKGHEWTPREFYINLGQFGRYYDPDIWVKSIGLEGLTGKIVIDDLRFPNEAKCLKKYGAKLIRVNRYEHLNIYGKNLDNESETALDSYKGFDFVVEDCVNVKLPDLYKQMDIVVKDLGFK